MPAAELINIQPKRILVITLRFLGDTLLTTPLISSLKQAYPNADIDVLLPAGNTAMLAGNPDISQLIALPKKISALDFGKLLFKLYRRYDLAISTQAGDRPALCAIMAGRISLSFVPDDPGKAWWKKSFLTHWLVFNQDYDHAVLENLRFCNLLGIKPCYRLTPPRTDQASFRAPDRPYAVLHIMPQWRYKQWHKAGWLELITFLNERGLGIVLTGSGEANELHYLHQLEQQLPTEVTNLAGKLSLAELTELISNAALFVGPDTGITHLAAATGTLTFALFGPTDPKKWAPWPFDFTGSIAPFSSLGSQHVGNVYLIQGQTDRNCMPCQLEGCERHRNSHSACLDQLSASCVIDTISNSLLTVSNRSINAML
ncbi:MAG: glycosyltransferase family 9 protein [Methylomonas sp.]|jgi:heptosyltransferase-3|uniref:glycosyltransferase family 9 protein n=1 Tax=Methylomonas sp. TaxID=418 RepID=UPI0025EB4862|nr:glycosyltransferase family 9 protein [Methylomonas sp.]MCK9607105.1 glycosyltransferase family 9 protein [Methylomonas sp.]